MSPNSQTALTRADRALTTPRPLVALSAEYAPATRIPAHRHHKHQLLYAVRGVMTVTAEAGRWVVPPQFAVWVPAGMTHTVLAHGALSMRTLWVAPDVSRRLPRLCGVHLVTPLMRELVLRAMELPRLYNEKGADGRLVAVLLDELAALSPAPLHLPWPRDPRAQRVARALQRRPANARTLAEWARSVGGGERTLARLFARETGLSFGAWRRRMRLLHAVERLGAGVSVTAVSLDCGYESASAFIGAFRRELGVSPARFAASGWGDRRPRQADEGGVRPLAASSA
ncbi:MAG: AraC family transcriptional regulator [Gammaproteobacteria bacterium]|nr:AraC family transcriptional regulator [Gammaproteobacteria bacterium]NIR85653.1 AraC family transcriptional regulator [Gammaproteobacteria bacterium]NIR90141.1 AraC family transcriptional regulator [Gammaproteobacteria bacterium]NIU06787.1 AraC family transcriptional regulator [Gammaproteobacteria bacterium]NIV53720.1 helix-turn-helix domain-containing protein [Gammaproteobacteria bacterium]